MKTRLLIPLMVGALMLACDLSTTPQPTLPAGTTPTATETLTPTTIPITETPTATWTVTPTEVPTMFPTDTPIQEVLSGDVNVNIRALHFAPEVIKVRAGSTIHWTNNDDTEHIIVADDGSFSSATLKDEDQFAFTFNTVGVFTYHCGIHALMKGTIIVVP